jgi:hypothetical protein
MMKQFVEVVIRSFSLGFILGVLILLVKLVMG